MKLALFYGTRPQIIKASSLLHALRATAHVFAIDTGQHYDWILNGALYEQLRVTPPDRFLEIGSGSHAEQTAKLLVACASAIEECSPDAVVVIGDTNSTLGAALAAAQKHVPVVHVEAGLRSGHLAMAEELNRRVVDTFAGLLCAPSARAASALAAENAPGRVAFTGDVARDVLEANRARATLAARELLNAASDAAGFVFSTLHRAELTTDRGLLLEVLCALDQLPLPVVLAAHPRTRVAIADSGFRSCGSLRVTDSVSYLEAVAAVQQARIVVTDSGGLQREAYWLGTPCITVRAETEWVETVTLGANTLVRPENAESHLPGAVSEALHPRRWDRSAYGNGNAARQIALEVAAFLDSGLSELRD